MHIVIETKNRKTGDADGEIAWLRWDTFPTFTDRIDRIEPVKTIRTGTLHDPQRVLRHPHRLHAQASSFPSCGPSSSRRLSTTTAGPTIGSYSPNRYIRVAMIFKGKLGLVTFPCSFMTM